MLYQPVKKKRLFLNIVKFLNKFLTNEENIIYCSRVHFFWRISFTKPGIHSKI